MSKIWKVAYMFSLQFSNLIFPEKSSLSIPLVFYDADYEYNLVLLLTL